jgi:hypothetical protein
MPADSISIGILILSWGATYFVHSTCLIAGIWLFVRVRRTAGHALRETLWKTALMGGVVTASVQMWLSPLGPFFGDFTVRVEGIAWPVAAAADSFAAKDSPASDTLDLSVLNRQGRAAEHNLAVDLSPADSAHDSWIATTVPNTEIADVAEGPHAARLAAGHLTAGEYQRSTSSQWIGALRTAPALPIGVALLAIVLGTARCSWQTISLRRRLARCRLIVGGPARDLLDELLRTVPRAPEVLLLSAPDDSEPAALGIARWTIVLPPRAAFDLSQDELRALLAHELAHLVRGDSLWLGISRALCSCLAFQPLNHLARREWQRTAEFLCDNWAVSRTGAPLALARCLTEVASWRLGGSASAAILAATGRKSRLVDRIERLLDARPVFESGNELRDRRRTVFAGAWVLALLACCAPRVQLVASFVNNGIVREDANLTGVNLTGVNLTGVNLTGVNLTGAAKPQASGEGQVREEESQDEALPAESENSAQSAARDDASLIEALDSDLLALQSELEQLGPLLRGNAAPQAVALARRLRGEIVRLQHRRELLKALWQKTVK